MEIVIAVGVVIGLAIAGLIGWRVAAARRTAALPPEVQANLVHARECRKRYRQLSKARDKRIKAAKENLAILESTKGKGLKTFAGLTLYERWIDTPQGGGSLIGVKAQAADESSIHKRLTVTRMVTLGIFSLAAKKKSSAGHAYIVVEGPEVSGVAVVAAQGNANAGPAAFSFAAQINNAARAAEAAEATRPQAIEAARAALARATADEQVAAASLEYGTATALLPPELQRSFADCPIGTQLPAPSSSLAPDIAGRPST